MHDAYRTLFARLYAADPPAPRMLKVTLHFERAEAAARRQNSSLEQAVRAEYERAFAAAGQKRRPLDPHTAILACDAGLGGLARWLRLWGYDARWYPAIDDGDLIEEAQRLAAVLLTTDSLMMERGLLRDGIVPALWVPPTLDKQGQLKWVLRELCLARADSRCTDCGGDLELVDKEKVRDRIPPRTYLWRDEYWQCRRCEKLFWRGTHWERIQGMLAR